MTDTAKLAERIEALDEPCREIDAEIARAMSGNPSNYYYDRFDGEWASDTHASHYTASLDAAMTLYKTLPERVPSDPKAACAEALRQRGGWE